MVFNILLTVFLFLQLLWFTAIISLAYSKLQTLETKVNDIQKGTLELAKAMRSMSEVEGIQVKLFQDLLTEVVSEKEPEIVVTSGPIGSGITSTTSGAKRPKKKTQKQEKY